jgi:hypothetical protein
MIPNEYLFQGYQKEKIEKNCDILENGIHLEGKNCFVRCLFSIRECAHFFTIDDQEVVYPCLFAFNFSGNVLSLCF